MRPGALLLRLLAAWCGTALAVLALRLWLPAAADAAALLWWGAGLALALTALVDALRRGHSRRVEVLRQLPDSLAVGVNNALALRLHNRGRHTLRIEVAEDHPEHFSVHGLPVTLALAPDTQALLHYQVVPQRRGEATLGRPWLRIASRLGLWQFRLRPDAVTTVKVYPNFAAISHFATVGLEYQIGALGIHLQQRRGEGMEFQQLREFREGDALRQVDWKATARYRKPISREYQEERDQDIIFLLDCGRRMRTKDTELSHFDHALNALLLTGHVALRQGDAVGLLTFAGSERWQPPLKGQSNINRLLQRVYDLHSSTATSDFLQAAQQLMQRHRKRALVILLSNIHEEDADDLRAAVQLLSSRHLVVVASLRELALDVQLHQGADTLDDALAYTGARRYAAERRHTLDRLRHGGTAVIDSTPRQLHVDLVNQYWRMKRSGVI